MEETTFNRDSTTRLSCRQGDYIIWCGFNGSMGHRKYMMKDAWRLRDGDFITITNRHQDLPSWFELHPYEVAGRLTRWMKNKLDSGYEPKEPLESPNIWRIYAGDRLALVGPRVNELNRHEDDISIITFDKNAVAIGESQNLDDDLLDFGFFDFYSQPQDEKELCEQGWQAISKKEIPRTVSAGGQWRLGG